jgi:hypothetical protein
MIIKSGILYLSFIGVQQMAATFYYKWEKCCGALLSCKLF